MEEKEAEPEQEIQISSVSSYVYFFCLSKKFKNLTREVDVG